MSAHAAGPRDPGSSPPDRRETRWTGTADDVASLSAWLTANGVDADAFGEDGAKSLVDLAVEIERGETTLVLDPQTSAPRRDVRVLRLLVTDEDARPGMVLIEARQEWESGSRTDETDAAVGETLGERGLARRVRAGGERGARQRHRRADVLDASRRKFGQGDYDGSRFGFRTGPEVEIRDVHRRVRRQGPAGAHGAGVRVVNGGDGVHVGGGHARRVAQGDVDVEKAGGGRGRDVRVTFLTANCFVKMPLYRVTSSRDVFLILICRLSRDCLRSQKFANPKLVTGGSRQRHT